MIVAMLAVRVVQMAGDEIVQVIAVRNLFVSAGRTVRVFLIVLPTAVRGSALRWIRGIDLHGVLVDMVAVNVMQMPIVQVVAVVAMANALVTTAGLMDMLMCRVGLVIVHENLLVLGSSTKRS
jgi:hypothetical protein